MRILVATSRTQGQRASDYHWAPDGEPVALYGFECGGGSIDDKCGCRRGWSGLGSTRVTTTAEVIESDMSDPDFRSLVMRTLIDAGWADDDPDGRAQADEVADEALRFAQSFPVGTVVERRGNRIAARRDR